MHSGSHRTSLFFLSAHQAWTKFKKRNQTNQKKPPNPTNFQWEFCKQHRSSLLGSARPCTSPANKNKKYIYILNFSPFLPPTAKLGKAGSPQVEKYHLHRCIYLNLSLCIKKKLNPVNSKKVLLAHPKIPLPFNTPELSALKLNVFHRKGLLGVRGGKKKKLINRYLCFIHLFLSLIEMNSARVCGRRKPIVNTSLTTTKIEICSWKWHRNTWKTSKGWDATDLGRRGSTSSGFRGQITPIWWKIPPNVGIFVPFF